MDNKFKITREMFKMFVKECGEEFNDGSPLYIGEAFCLVRDGFNDWLDKKEKENGETNHS